ncbi:MAG: PIN domain-containing protein [Thermoleophilaceae bacterium]
MSALDGLLLDTTVLIDVLRGRAAADRLKRLRGAAPPPYVSAVNIEEVWRGLRPGEEAAAQQLFDGLRLAELGRREGRLAGTWRGTYAARGVTLAQADCLIAAAAHGVGARLATGNPRDFPMGDVDIDHWPVGR